MIIIIITIIIVVEYFFLEENTGTNPSGWYTVGVKLSL